MPAQQQLSWDNKCRSGHFGITVNGAWQDLSDWGNGTYQTYKYNDLGDRWYCGKQESNPDAEEWQNWPSAVTNCPYVQIAKNGCGWDNECLTLTCVACE